MGKKRNGKMTVADMLSRRIAGIEYSLQLVAQALGRINQRVDVLTAVISRRPLTKKRASARIIRKKK